MPSFTAHALPSYGMSGSFHSLIPFMHAHPQHKTDQETGYCQIYLEVSTRKDLT